MKQINPETMKVLVVLAKEYLKAQRNFRDKRAYREKIELEALEMSFSKGQSYFQNAYDMETQARSILIGVQTMYFAAKKAVGLKCI